MKPFRQAPDAPVASKPGFPSRPGQTGRTQPPWLAKLRTSHLKAATLATLGVVFLHQFGRLPIAVEVVILAASVAVMGLLHGALDHLTGRALFVPSFGRYWLVAFTLAYLGLGGLVIALWLIEPIAALGLFLVVAAAHFGMEDLEPGLAFGAGSKASTPAAWFEAITRGGWLISALLLIHPAEVQSLFGMLMPGQDAALAAGLEVIRIPMGLVNAGALVVVSAHYAKRGLGGSRPHALVALELATLTALFCLTTPLIAFVVYFCLWHSVRHSLTWMAKLDPSGPGGAARAFVRHGWPTTLATIVMAVGAYGVAATVQSPTDAIVRTVFIGLSALTIPHIAFSRLAADTHRTPAVIAASLL